MLRQTQPALAVFLLLFLVTVLSSPACSSANKRTKTLQTTVLAINAARDGFLVWEREHLLSIVKKTKASGGTREDAIAAEQAYQVRKKPVHDGFEIAYRALAVAATQADDLSFRTAMSATADLLDAIKKLTGGS